MEEINKVQPEEIDAMTKSLCDLIDEFTESMRKVTGGQVYVDFDPLGEITVTYEVKKEL